MFSKINPKHIILDNLKTFQSVKPNHRYYLIDFFIFILLPLSVAICVALFGINREILGYVATTISIFSGMLLSFLVLIWDQKFKINNIKANDYDRKTLNYISILLSDTHSNVSYCILLCLLSLAMILISYIDINIPLPCLKNHISVQKISMSIVLGFFVQFILFLLMITKRCHDLIQVIMKIHDNSKA